MIRSVKSIILAISLIPCATYADDAPKTWHLLQKQANGGIAGILHGLTKHECEFAKDRVEGNPATPEEKNAYQTREDAMMSRFSAWIKDHPDCKGVISTTGILSNGKEFSQDRDGTCFWSQPGGGIGRTYSPHDVTTAECFQ